MALNCKVFIDWSGGTSVVPSDEITDYVKSVSWSTGMNDITERVAPAGQCSIVVDNSDKRFSPANSSSPYYGNMLPGRFVQVQDLSARPIWSGYVRTFQPDSSEKVGGLECQIACHDMLGVLQDVRISMPLIEDQTPGATIKGIIAEAVGAAASNSYVEVLGTPSDGDTLTIDDRVYTFKTTLTSTADQIKIHATPATQAIYIAAAIVSDAAGNGTYYSTPTTRHERVTAMVSPNPGEDEKVLVDAVVRGTWGNGITLSTSSAALVDGGNLAGGSTKPVGLTNIDDGKRTFDIVGDLWRSGETTAYRALSDAVLSDWGVLYVQGDGVLRYRDSDFAQEWMNVIDASVSPLHEDLNVTRTSGTETTWTQITARISVDDIINSCEIEYIPRAFRSYGVVAKSSGVIEVPSGSGSARWADSAVEGGFVVSVPYVDQDTGNLSGAKEVTTPQANTDYTVNDQPNGSGYDYTLSGRIGVSVSVRGGQVEVSFTNTATGNLYVRNLQVRGVGVIRNDPLRVKYANSSSIGTYGTRTDDYSLPMLNDRNFAQSLAEWLVSTRATPRLRVFQVNYQNTFSGTDNNLPIEEIGKSIGKHIALTDSQLSLSDRHATILGVTGSINVNGTQSITYRLYDTDGMTSWQLGATGFGKLGLDTYLAL